MGDVVRLDIQFDATVMTCDEIRQDARQRGWPGISINADEFQKTGRLIVRRLSKKHAFFEPHNRSWCR